MNTESGIAHVGLVVKDEGGGGAWSRRGGDGWVSS